MKRTVLSILFLIAGITLSVAQGNKLTVSNTDDSGTGSLRAQLLLAVDGDTIWVDPSLSTGTLHLTSGQLEITKSIIMYGNGLTVYANSNSRVFYANNLASLTIDGFGITRGGGVNEGAGIYANNIGDLLIQFCEISRNTSSSYVHSYGGGVFASSSSITFANNTISGNTATSSAASYPTYSYGGGVYANSSSITFTNNTISGNTTYSFSSTSYGGGVYASSSSSINFKGNIIALNSDSGTMPGSDVYTNGTTVSNGYNLIGDNTDVTTLFPSGSPNSNMDYVGTSASPVDPLLNALADNGGQTRTMALDPGSPAINAGDPTDNSTDQRGSVVRNGRKDIGAFELFQKITADGSNALANQAVCNIADGLDDMGFHIVKAEGDSIMVDSIRSSNQSVISNGNISFTPLAKADSVINNGNISFSSLSGLGTTTITIYASDSFGEIGTTSFNVFVGDQTAPVIAIADDTLFVDGNNTVSLDSATLASFVTDNCALDSVGFSQLNFTCSHYGENELYITAKDANGNIAKDTISVWVYSALSKISVSNTNDAGCGSMRSALAAATNGDTIWVDESLALDTLHITSGQLEIESDLVMYGNGLTVDADSNSRVFYATTSGSLTIDGFGITGGGLVNEGAGIYALNIDDLVVRFCEISHNTSSAKGGGVYANSYSSFSSSITFTNNMISGNSSSSRGGGVYAYSSSYSSASASITFTNNTISGNSSSSSSSSSYGGGVYAYSSSSITFTNNTISGNSSSSYPSSSLGGGVYANSYSSSINFKGNIIALNSVSGGGTNEGPDVYTEGTTVSNGYNLIGDNTDATTLFPSGGPNSDKDYVGTSASPIDPLLNVLADNGGLTQTMSLQAGSPAIDPVDRPDTDTDQRGALVVNSLKDIGAFEYNSFPCAQTVACLSTSTTQKVCNTNDAGCGSLREALFNATNGDTIWVDESLALDTLHLTSGQLNIAASIILFGNGLTVDADSLSRVFFAENLDSLTIDGFGITGGGSVRQGAGIYALNIDDLVVRFCEINNNASSSSSSSSYGGGVYASSSSSSSITFTNNTISGNSSSSSLSYGGGVYAYAGSITFTNNTISGNTSSSSSSYSEGGGVYARSASSITFTNNTISGNSSSSSSSSSSYGGGVYAYSYSSSSSITFTNNTISGNTATSSYSFGGGVYARSASSTFKGNIIALNSVNGSGTTADVYTSGTTVSNGYNLIGDNTTVANNFTATGDTVGTSASPLDPLLYALADNGGPTFTMSLRAGSPALNPFGRPDSDPDQRGEAVVDGLKDIGAFENNNPPTATNDTITVAGGTTTSIHVLALGIADSDIEGNVFIHSVGSLSDHSSNSSNRSATLVINENGTAADSTDDYIEYMSGASIVGYDTLYYVIKDAGGLKDTASVLVIVNPISQNVSANITYDDCIPVKPLIGLGNTQEGVFYKLKNSATNETVDWMPGNGQAKGFDTLEVSKATTYKVEAQHASKGLSFNGASNNEYIAGGTGLDLANNSFTISLWARIEENRASADISLFHQGTIQSTDNLLHARVYNSTEIQFAFWGNDLSATGLSLDSNWHYYSFTYDATSRQRIIYLDGDTVGSDVSPSDYQGSGDFNIGREFGGTGYWDGDLDEISVWSKALTQSEIASNMHTCLSGNEADLLAYLDLEEITGSVITDRATAQKLSGATLMQMTSLENVTQGVSNCSGFEAVPMNNTVEITVDISVTNLVATDTTIYLNASGAFTMDTSFVHVSSSDACGLDTVYASKISFDCSNVGPTNTVQLYALDVNGNLDSASATVTVVDTINPLVVTIDTTIYLNASGAFTMDTSFVHVSSSDACGFDTVYASKIRFDCSNAGPNTVQLYALDMNGNLDSASANVMVVDTINPLVTAMDTTIYLNASGAFTMDTSFVHVSSSDACGLDTVYASKISFDCSNVGPTNTVQLYALDNNGNLDSASANVRVVDTINPLVTAIDTTIYLNASGAFTMDTSFVHVSSSDACGLDTVYASKISFDCSNVGQTRFSYMLWM
jgi:hypothetical protein